MAGNTNLDEDNTTSEAKGPASHPQAIGSFYKLFTFADSSDQLLMFVGTIACMGSGICMPLMTLILGDMIDAFGVNVKTKQLVHEVSKVSLKFIFLAVGSFFASFLSQ